MPDALILIPARSGSTRVKHKNIKYLGGMPLIGHSITQAVASKIGRVIVSTDSEDIVRVANEFGAQTPFLRPDILSTSTAPSSWVILHALQWLRDNENYIPRIVAYCPPTNPFIKSKTICEMFNIFKKEENFNSIVTITKPKTHPFRTVRKGKKGKLDIGAIEIDQKTIRNIERSQDWPEVWENSPACRMTFSAFFFNLLERNKNISGIACTKTYDVDSCTGYEIGSVEAMDIDDNDDWLMAEQVFRAVSVQPRIKQA